MMNPKFAWIVIIPSLLFSCVSLSYEAETSTVYTQFIGKSYITLRPLSLSGLRGSDEIVDYVHVTTRPGLSGPEYAYRKALPQGSIFTIVSIESCFACASQEKRWVIEFTNIEGYQNDHVVVSTSTSRIVSLSENRKFEIRDDIIMDLRMRDRTPTN